MFQPAKHVFHLFVTYLKKITFHFLKDNMSCDDCRIAFSKPAYIILIPTIKFMQKRWILWCQENTSVNLEND